MKVLFRAHSPCIRTYKEAKALKSLGVKTALLYDGKTVGSRYPGLNDNDAFDEIYPMALRAVHDPCNDSIYHFIEDHNFDIVHNAHPPDWPVRQLRGCGIPIIHDFHDLYSLENANAVRLRHEKDAARWAYGLVYVSEKMVDYMKDRYPSQALPYCVVGNAADDHPVIEQSRPWPENEIHLVYSAAMPRWNERHFRDLSGLLSQLQPQGIHLHVQAVIVVPGLKQEAQRNPLLHIEPPRTGREMIESMTVYDAAVWYCREDIPEQMTKLLDLCLPNKLYEYWQAGIPILTKGGELPEWFVRHYRIGQVVKDFSNIRNALTKKYEPIRNVITMKEEAASMIDLYEEVSWQ